jgi:branched-chain amino acid transport system substrate-binding protein
MTARTRLAVLISMSAVVGCSNSEKPPLALAHVYRASTPDGVEAQRGIELALEDLGGAVVTQGRALAVRQADTRGEAAAFEAEAVRQAAVHRTPVLLGGTTPAELLALDKARVPFLSPVSYRPAGLDDMAFLTGISAKARARALAQYLVEERAIREACLLLDERVPDADEFANAFKTRWNELREKHSLREVEEELRWAKEMKIDEVAALARAHPIDRGTACWVFLGAAEDFALVRKRDVKLLVYAGQDAAPATLGAEEVVLATAFAVDAQLPKTGEFAEKYKKKYKAPATSVAALAYDNVRMVAAALKAAFPPHLDRLREELRNTKNFEGLAGPLSFTSEQTLERPVFVGAMTDGILAAVKRYGP